MITGLPEHKAKFQVISLLTTTGFTTKESELITNNRTRRKLAIATNIFGYVFSATFVSAFVNFLVKIGTQYSSSSWIKVGITLGVMLFLLIICNIKPVKKRIDKLIMQIARKFMRENQNNQITVLDKYAESSICEVIIKNIPECLKNVTLEDSHIKQNCGVQVLAILRKNKNIELVGKDEILQIDDQVALYGNYNKIKMLFEIPNESNKTCKTNNNVKK